MWIAVSDIHRVRRAELEQIPQSRRVQLQNLGFLVRHFLYNFLVLHP